MPVTHLVRRAALAVVTAVVEAGGGGKLTSPSAVLGACWPALGLITAISAIGALVAISGLRRRSYVRSACSAES